MAENTLYLDKSTSCACIVCEKTFSPLRGPWTCGRCHTKYQQGRQGRGGICGTNPVEPPSVWELREVARKGSGRSHH